MTFYQKVEALCKGRGITVTALTQELSFSGSAGTTWKRLKGKPRNSTLKKIADYFEITIDELEEGIDVPLDYDSVDTSSFRKDVYGHLLEIHKGNSDAAIKAYLAFEKAEAEDAAKEQSIAVQDNHGIVGHAHAPVTIVNGSERKLTAQESALLGIFEKLDIVKQAQLLSFAADLAK